MVDRAEVEARIRELHAARVRGDLAAMCQLFTDDAAFHIAGSSGGKPIEIAAHGLRELKPWLAMLVKTFSLSDYVLLAMIVDGTRAAIHWRAEIFSKITGKSVATELVDLIEIRGGRIARYKEFFVPK